MPRKIINNTLNRNPFQSYICQVAASPKYLNNNVKMYLLNCCKIHFLLSYLFFFLVRFLVSSISTSATALIMSGFKYYLTLYLHKCQQAVLLLVSTPLNVRSHDKDARSLPASGPAPCSKDTIIMGFDCLSLNLNNWWLQYLLHYLCVVNIHYRPMLEIGEQRRAQGTLARGERLSVWLMTQRKKYLIITLEKRYSSLGLIGAICILKVSAGFIAFRSLFFGVASGFTVCVSSQISNQIFK